MRSPTLAQMHELNEYQKRARDFTDIVFFMMRGGRGIYDAAREAAAAGSERCAAILKSGAAVTLLSELSTYQAVASAWSSFLKHSSLTDAIIAQGIQVPRHGVIGVVGAVGGAIVGEARAKRTSAIDFATDDMDVFKAIAIIVAANVFLRQIDAPRAAIDEALRNAVIKASDGEMISILSNGATSAASSDDLKTDVLNVLANLTRGSNARLIWCLGSTVHSHFMSRPVADRPAIFAESTVIRSDDMTADSVLVVDAAQICVHATGLEIDTAAHASLEIDSAPLGHAEILEGSPPSEYPTQALTSLFQTHSTAIRCEREIRVKRLRTSAVRILTSVDWSGASP